MGSLTDFFGECLKVLAVVLPLVIPPVLAWFFNERSKRASSERLAKEKKYEEFILNIDGFTVSGQDPEKKRKCIEMLRLCWLYSNDRVIKASNEFFDSVSTGLESPTSEKIKYNLFGKMMLEIRKDVISNKPLNGTFLEAEDFKIRSPSEVELKRGMMSQYRQEITYFGHRCL